MCIYNEDCTSGFCNPFKNVTSIPSDFTWL
jgi:hypothetical protein